MNKLELGFQLKFLYMFAQYNYKVECLNSNVITRNQQQLPLLEGEVCVIVGMAHVISMEQSLPTKDESKNDGLTSRGHDQTVVPTDLVSTSRDIVIK